MDVDCTCPMDEMHPACDVHGQPSAAYAVGRDEGQRFEREAWHAQQRGDVDALATEVRWLRARDEAAKAVARLWDGTVYDTTNDNPLWSALDTLVRAHEDGGIDQ